jgi:hypothetical protein
MNQLLRVQPKNNPSHQKRTVVAEQDSDSGAADASYSLSTPAAVEQDGDSGGAAEAPYPLLTPASSSVTAEQGSQEGVLEMKHKLAMESYIQQKMTIGAAISTSEATNSNDNPNETNKRHRTRDSPTRHDAYQRASFVPRTRRRGS